jgi:hypothetical protein
MQLLQSAGDPYRKGEFHHEPYHCSSHFFIETKTIILRIIDAGDRAFAVLCLQQ